MRREAISALERFRYIITALDITLLGCTVQASGIAVWGPHQLSFIRLVQVVAKDKKYQPETPSKIVFSSK